MDILLQRVLYLIKKYNVSLYAVEKAAQLSDGALRRWGKSPPSSDRLLRVARYFGVSVDFLLGNTDNPKSHLNSESIDLLSVELRSIADNLEKKISASKKEFDGQLEKAISNSGIKSGSGIDIDTYTIMNDPNLPR